MKNEKFSTKNYLMNFIDGMADQAKDFDLVGLVGDQLYLDLLIKWIII